MGPSESKNAGTPEKATNKGPVEVHLSESMPLEKSRLSKCWDRPVAFQ